MILLGLFVVNQKGRMKSPLKKEKIEKDEPNKELRNVLTLFALIFFIVTEIFALIFRKKDIFDKLD